MRLIRSNKEREPGLWGYIKYAFSEIALVVIGILIAVSINNCNELRKEKLALKDIHQTIKEDLVSDIQEIEVVLKGYAMQKPFYGKVINDSLSLDDYKKNPSLGYLIMGYPEIKIEERGYRQLLAFNATDTLSSKIVSFYSERLLEIDVDDKFRARDFEENYSHWKENYTWWTPYIFDKRIGDFTDYALNDDDYKRRVATAYFLAYDVYLPELELFVKGANEIVDELGRE